jgi:hypothetical protein
MLESALVLIVFLMVLFAIMDFSQVLFTHQMLVERTRSGLRWGMIHAWDGTGDGIANMIRYNQSTAGSGTAFMGLTRANISVTYTLPTPTDPNPNDARLMVAIVDYNYQFVTPFLANSFTNNRAVIQSAPYMFRN